MAERASNGSSTTAKPQRWIHRIGPGLITACVVIGPGSILTSSKVGATYGFQMSWVIVIAVLCMTAYTTMGAKLGVVASESPGKLLADRVGRWLAVLIGAGVFLISAAFQFANNLGVLSAVQEYESLLNHIPFFRLAYVIVALNILSIMFLFSFRNLYRMIERLMMVLVGVMLLCFTVNLFFARPDMGEFLRGFVPPVGKFTETFTGDWSLLGLIGTTFVITAAFFQSYLVRQKGWQNSDLRSGLVDARIGAILMALITIMLMATSAAILRGQSLNDVGDVAAGLIAFGRAGHALFCLGLVSAAYSSFLINSMVGGFILSDGLGIGYRPTDLAPRILTTVVLLTGMIVALAVHQVGWSPVPTIVAAQAATVVIAPLVAAALWWLTNQSDIMGEQRNGGVMNGAALIGFLLLLAIAGYTAIYKVWPGVTSLLAPTEVGLL